MNAPPRVEPLRLRRVPLVVAALCFACGDLLALRWHPPAQLVAATSLLLLLCWLSLRNAPRLALLPVLALWIAVGCWSAHMQPPVGLQRPLQAYADGLSRTLRGTVVRVHTVPAPAANASTPPPEFSDDGWELDDEPARQSIDLDITAAEYLTPDISQMVPVQGGARLLLSGAPLPLHCGDVLEVPLRLRTPDIYRTPGAFSYADTMLAEGIGVTATTPASRVAVVHASQPTLRCRLYAAQAWAAGRLETYTGSPANRALPHAARLTQQDAALLNAMLFGDRTRLSHTLRLGFERTGTFHLFVVSGLHVALLALAVFWMLRRLRLPDGSAVALTLIIATAYTMLAGFGVPAQRALIMTAVFLVAQWLDRRRSAFNAMGAAALVVLALDPRALYEASFQMTFLVILSAAGIASPCIERWLQPHQRALKHLDIIRIDAHLHPRLAQFRLRVRMACDLSGALLGRRWQHVPLWLLRAGLHIAQALLLGLAAELCMSLPMALYFHRATVVALPLNLVDIPLLSILLAVAVAMFLCSLLSTWLAMIPAAVAALLLHAMRFTVERAQHWPLADLRIPGPAPWACALSCAAIAAACLMLRSKNRRLLAAGLAAAFLAPAATLWPAPPLLHPGTLEVTALDVGQGDSLLVAAPEGQTLLVDAGGPVGRGPLQPSSSFDVGEEVVAPYLWSRRIRRLDAVLLTHAHSDHMGGMSAVLRDLRPRELWLSIEPAQSPQLRALLQQAAESGIVIRHLHAGDAFTWSGVQATVLAPELGYANPGAAINDDSLVLRLQYGRASVLLEGDAQARSEAAMLQHDRVNPVTLLKIGHHGSRTSTSPDFLAAAAPREAVISVGRHNTFGHPRAEVLARLEAAHVQTFRTDRHGTETFLLSPDGTLRSQSTDPR